MADEPTRIFYSYSHRDAALRDELETHLAALKRSGTIQGWSDRAITGGQEWAGQIDSNLEAADIVLLLVSADFIASDYCYGKEMARALEKHNTGVAQVIPIILRPVHWENTPFHTLQALPTGAKAVTTWPNRDEAWVNVIEGIHRAVQSLRVPSNTLDTNRDQTRVMREPLTLIGPQSYRVSIPIIEVSKIFCRRVDYKSHSIDIELSFWLSWQRVFYDLHEVSRKSTIWSDLSIGLFPITHLFSVSEDGQNVHYEIRYKTRSFTNRITVQRNGMVIWEGKK